MQVREADVRMALTGKDTVRTRCMALSLRELHEGELRTWIAHGLITSEELRRCQALDPRRQHSRARRGERHDGREPDLGDTNGAHGMTCPPARG